MSVKLFFDGASKFNGKDSGAGWVIKDTGKPDIKGCRFLGYGTNNEAEYKALIYGLRECMLHYKNVSVYGDSLLVINQMKGLWKVKAKNLLPLYNDAKECAMLFENIEFTHVERSLNKDADLMANLSIK
jgi:ribonuclease HI